METVDADRIVRRIFEGGINKGDFAAVAKHLLHRTSIKSHPRLRTRTG